jgi:predicted DNA-binding protein with PD1-like motif
MSQRHLIRRPDPREITVVIDAIACAIFLIIAIAVSSWVEARFNDGRATRNFATEVFITHGEIATDATGTLVAHLDVGLVDYQGETASGVLLRGDNPVLMTFELVLAQTA